MLLAFPWVGQAAQTLLVFGDSISAGYGLPPNAGWVHLLQQRLAKTMPDVKVVNASISGETAAGGRRRIEAALDQHRPDIVVLQLGGNDGLRGARIDALQADLESIVTAVQKRKARVLLVGMRIPPNYGADYVNRFAGVYGAVAKKFKVALVPFLFEGFGDQHDYFQPDDIHPTRAAQPLMLDTVWKALEPMLRAR